MHTYHSGVENLICHKVSRCGWTKWLILMRIVLPSAFPTKTHWQCVSWYAGSSQSTVRLCSRSVRGTREQQALDMQKRKQARRPPATPDDSRRVRHVFYLCHPHLAYCSSLLLINSSMDFLTFHLSPTTQHSFQFYWEIHAGWLSAFCEAEQSDWRNVCARFCVRQYSFYLGNQQIQHCRSDHINFNSSYCEPPG